MRRGGHAAGGGIRHIGCFVRFGQSGRKANNVSVPARRGPVLEYTEGMTAKPDSQRLDALETRIVHQDEVIEDLNKTVAEQWKEIDRLTRELAMLSERVEQSEQSAGEDAADEPPPPHY